MSLRVLSFRDKVLRRLASPVELVYALTKHWFIVLVAIALGTAVMLAKVLSQPAYFEARATLFIKANDTLLSVDGRPLAVERDPNSFLNEQLAILQSDSVLERVVIDIGARPIISQEEEQAERDGQRGPLTEIIRAARKKFDTLMTELRPAPVGNPEERSLQRAKAAFRRNSDVRTDRRPGIVKLVLRGANHRTLEDHLNAWISAFLGRLEAQRNDTFRRLLNSRVARWAIFERDAKGKLDLFRKDNPEVSQERLAVYKAEVARLQVFITDFQRLQAFPKDLDVGPRAPILGDGSGINTPPPNPKIERLRRQLDEAEARVSQYEVKFGKESVKAIAQRREAAAYRDELKREEENEWAHNSPRPRGEGSKGGEDESDAAKLARLQEQLAIAVDRQDRIGSKVQELGELESSYRSARRTKDEAERMLALEDEQIDVRKTVEVSVPDGPKVDLNPVTADYVQVAAGSGAGLAIGFVLAFGVELLCRRVRYKREIEEELGIPVIAVIPRE